METPCFSLQVLTALGCMLYTQATWDMPEEPTCPGICNVTNIIGWPLLVWLPPPWWTIPCWYLAEYLFLCPLNGLNVAYFTESYGDWVRNNQLVIKFYITRIGSKCPLSLSKADLGNQVNTPSSLYSDLPCSSYVLRACIKHKDI